MKSKTTIFFNGSFLSEKEARISVLEPGFLYGWGLFETMRAYQQNIIYLPAHLKRISKGSGLIHLKFPYSVKDLKKIVLAAVKISGLKDAYLRITLWKDAFAKSSIMVLVKRYEPYPAQKYKKGFSLCTSGFLQNENSFLAQLKTNNYLLYQLSFLEAKSRGFDEALILNSRGYIAEASRANLFFIKDKKIFTPSLECGSLEGITRKVVFDLARKKGLEINEGKFTSADLSAADEAFLTNSLMGIMPLVRIDKDIIGQGKSGKITCLLMKEYNLLLKNGA